jgi:[acyl-carrier-protein] S-malonyltransferase
MGQSVTLIFPGQGTQYVGMGKSLEGESYFDVFSDADKVLGYPLSKMMFEGPEEELQLTQNTQPAILSHSVALFKKLKEILDEKGITIDRVLGHSVGEYAALVAAGVLSHQDAARAVHFRGQFMQAAVPAGKGKMYAIMKVPQDIIEKACAEASSDASKVMPANFNEPNQIVISGEASACDKAVELIGQMHGENMRAVELKVSAPFHSSLMEPAAEQLKTVLDEIEFKANDVPYIANIDAKEYASGTSPETIKKNLINQVAGSVQWTQSVQSLPDDTLCLEVGPGRVLMGLIRKINRNIPVISLDKDGAFDDLKEKLSEG